MINNKDIAIYYFSATGNSLKLSLDIASHFGGAEVFNIGAKNEVKASSAPMVGFIFPIYMGGVPNVVRKFLQNYPYQKEVYYFSIGTYYTYRGCAMSVVNKILSDNGVLLNYWNSLPSVGNCLKEYEVSTNKRIKILKQSEVETQRIISDLANKRTKTLPRYCRVSDMIHKGLFKAFFRNSHLAFTVEDNCSGCKVCEKICPVNNIFSHDGVPQWDINCEACHACVHWCPQNAIHIGRSKGRLQYQNPAIKRSMLFNT